MSDVVNFIIDVCNMILGGACAFYCLRCCVKNELRCERDSLALTEIHHNLEAIRAMLELRERK